MRKKFIALGVMFVFLVGGAAVFAVKDGNVFGDYDSKMAKGVVYDGDYFAADDEVEILGTVKGDLYVAGGNVKVDGNVEGDVLAAGGKVEIGGKVGGDVRVAGGDVLISADIGKNVTATAGTLDFARSAKVRGSGVLFGGDMKVAGMVGKNLKIGAQKVVIDNQIAGDARIAANSVQLDQGARISGDLMYASPTEAMVDRKVAVGGEIERFSMGNYDYDERGERSFGFGALVIGFLSILLIGVIFVWFAPNLAKRSAEVVSEKPFKALLWGLLFLILTPFAAFLLMVTLIGLPLGLILFVAYFFTLYVAKIFFALWVGYMILKAVKKEKVGIVWALVLGLLVHRILVMVPQISSFVGLVYMVFGLGTVIIVKTEFVKMLKKKKLV